MSVREARDGWYVDLGDESAGPFDDEHEAHMAAQRIEYQLNDMSILESSNFPKLIELLV